MPDTALPRLADTEGNTTLNAAITATATSITIDNADWVGVGHYPLLLLIDGELIEAYGVTTMALQTFNDCVRAVNGVAKAHAAGTAVTVAEPSRLAL